jgi:hypothetical protein
MPHKKQNVRAMFLGGIGRRSIKGEKGQRTGKEADSLLTRDCTLKRLKRENGERLPSEGDNRRPGREWLFLP